MVLWVLLEVVILLKMLTIVNNNYIITGFVFSRQRPENNDRMPLRKNFHKLNAREIPIVLVELDQQINYSISPIIPNLIPIGKFCSDTQIKGHYFRYQLPLDLAHCSTTHKRQGVTATFGAVILPTEYSKTPFSRGLEYVQLSRARKLEDIILLSKFHKNHFESHYFERQSIAKEYQRLEKYSIL